MLHFNFLNRVRQSGRMVLATCLGGFVCCGMAGSAMGQVDLLQLPALIAPKADQALILSVDQNDEKAVAVGERGVILIRELASPSSKSSVIFADQSWVQAEVPVSVTLTSVEMASAEVWFAVGHDGVVLRTTNAGKTWALVFDGNQANAQVIQAAKDRYEQVQKQVQARRNAYSNEGDAQKSELMESLEAYLEEQLFAYEDAQAGARFGPARPFLGVWFKDDQMGWVVGSYGQIFETRDGGDSWQLISDRLDNPDYRHYNNLYGDESGILVLTGESGRVHLSTNFGKTWKRQDTGYTGHLYGAHVRRQSASGDQFEILAYGFGGTLFYAQWGRSEVIWKQVTGPSDQSLVGAVPDEQNIGLWLVDRLGRLIFFRWADRFVTWVESTEGAQVTDLARVGNALLVGTRSGPQTAVLPTLKGQVDE